MKTAHAVKYTNLVTIKYLASSSMQSWLTLQHLPLSIITPQDRDTLIENGTCCKLYQLNDSYAGSSLRVKKLSQDWFTLLHSISEFYSPRFSLKICILTLETCSSDFLVNLSSPLAMLAKAAEALADFEGPMISSTCCCCFSI